MRYARRVLWVLCGVLLAWGLFPAQIGRAQVSVLNYFAQVAGGSSDNVLNIDGTLNFENKATVIDHGVTTLDGSNPTTVTTTLSSNVTCEIVLKNAVSGASPGDDPTYVTAVWTTGTSTLDIYAWKNTSGTDPTFVASTNSAATVAYVCFGAD